MKPTTHQEALLELAGTTDSDIRKQVWPSLKSLLEDNPQAHQQALAALARHHQRLRRSPYRVRSVDSINAVREYAPFTTFEFVIGP